MAKHSGRNGVLKVGGSDLECTQGWEVTETMGTIEADCMGDTHQSYVNDLITWGGSMTFLHDEAATVQPTLVLGSVLAAEFYDEGEGSGANYLSGNIRITEIGRPVNKGEVVTRSVSFVGDGVLTIATVA